MSGEAVPKRADARRNAESVVAAAAAAFVEYGVEAPVRDIAARAGVGVGTVYRRFPTRADLVVAVYRHQVEACARAGEELLAGTHDPHDALARWVDGFVDLLVTKHGLAEALHGDEFETLHAWFLDALLPVCDRLLDAVARADGVAVPVGSYGFLRGIGNLCIGAGSDVRYDPRALVALLLAGLRSGR
ncbi:MULTISPECIES: TetR/AcrR family transcriptional regulator [Pseudonocardia]|uniref:TetR family transcriptional regulator n=1 Tax=Pseudonocardia saturnea TaxID=33909 RepID=A0ABQ0SA06_9PSEU|nr:MULTISPECIES: TetR/AcrR family transcriptional regulator [Pseudonocardia]BBG02524.1 TetR family transcriptional regulator [Pseudonocardia autotrophica]GEC29424.1 TetR family transcriptional regulator [Pseudonocardia saturnea]